MPINRKVRGIRGPIPAGHILGRVDGGDGDVQLLSLADLGRFGLAANVVVAGGGGSGGGGTPTPTPTPTGGSYIPLVDGAEPPGFITDGAGQLILVGYTP